jgi:4-cresol dehydrogenase (hydroxylating) flavoprotein subunit
MKRELGLGYWNLYGTVYGPPPVMETFLGMIKDAFLQVPGAQFFTHHDRDEATDRGAHVLHDRHRINNGIPSLDEMKLMEFIPNGGHIGFSPVSAPVGADALKQSKMVRRRADEYSKDYAAQFIVGLREMHHIGLFLFDTADPTARQETLDLASILIDEAASEGYGEYRTHNALMDQVMGTYSWGDGALRKFHETIKDALDPNSIIAPGQVRHLGQKVPRPTALIATLWSRTAVTRAAEQQYGSITRSLVSGSGGARSPGGRPFCPAGRSRALRSTGRARPPPAR